MWMCEWTSKMQIIFNNLRYNKDQNVHANQHNLQEYRQLNHFILLEHCANYKKFSHSLTLQNKNKRYCKHTLLVAVMETNMPLNGKRGTTQFFAKLFC